MAIRNPNAARLDLRRTNEIKTWLSERLLPGMTTPTVPSAPHNLLGATHPDTSADTPTRGSLVAANATPLWDELVLGGLGAGSIVTRDANDVLWSAYALSGTAGQTYTFPPASASLVGGTGASPRVAYWADANNITSDAGLTVDAAGDGYVVATGGYVGITADVRTVYDSGNGRIIETLGDSAGADEWRVNGSGGANVANIDSTGYGYFAGHVGIGLAADAAYQLAVYDAAINTAANRFGIFNYQEKTAGASDVNDLYIGAYNDMTIDQAGGTVGDVTGAYNAGRLGDGTVGSGGASKYVVGTNSYISLAGGTIWGYAASEFVLVEQTAGNTLNGDLYGALIDVDADGTVSGSVYMLYLQERSNIDYGIYQNGTAPNRLAGDTGIGTTPTAGQLHVDQSAAAGAQPALYIDQGDVSEQHIVCSMDGADQDFPNILQLAVTGSPALWWDESENSFGLKNISGLLVEDDDWIGISGTDLRTVYDSSSGYIINALGDAAGADEWRVNDSGGTNVANIDSDGNGYFAGIVGIGSAPSSRLTVYEGTSPAGESRAVLAQNIHTSAINCVDYIKAAQFGAYEESPAGVTNTGYSLGLEVYGYLNSAATITQTFGLRVTTGIRSTHTGTVGTAYGVRVSIANSSGTITTGYALYLDPVNATTKWGIYQNDTAASHLGGDLSVGGTTTPAAQLHVDQSSSTGAQPVLYLDQADVSEEAIYYVGTSDAATADQTLVDPADFTTPGALIAWVKVVVSDTRAGGIGTVDGWQPVYAIPTA